MSKGKVIGFLLLIGSIGGIIVYGWLIFFSQFSRIVMQLTEFVAVVAILSISIWLGYSLFTTPVPEEKNPDLDIEELDEMVKESEEK